MNNVNAVQLAELVNMDSPEAVLEEVKYNFIQSYKIEEFRPVREAFENFQALYSGNYTGYKGFSNPYHDLKHSTDTFLALSRMVDGYNLENKKLPVDKVVLGLIVSLFHDSGYIRKKKERSTAKISDTQYISRSTEFIKQYLKKNKYSEKDISVAVKMLECTSLDAEPSKIKFGGSAAKTIGYMVGTSDLVGQMSTRTYLEKLLSLFNELKEANIIKKKDVSEILKDKIDFYRIRIWERFDGDFDGVFAYHTVHFMKRYGVECNLYIDSIEKQVVYLEEIMENSPRSFEKKLKRRS
jgi:hypothetical protein